MGQIASEGRGTVRSFEEPLARELIELRESLDQERAKRQRAEAALRLSEERYEVLTGELQVGVIIQGPSAEILLSNPKAFELLGLTEAQLLGTTSFDPSWNVIHEDGSPFPGATHPVPVAIATGKAVRNVVMGVYRPVPGDRAWLLVNAYPRVSAEGHVRQVVCTFADITARKRAEEDYQTLFREMLDGFALHELICDDLGRPVDYRFLAVNPAFERMTGLEADRILGRTVTEVLPGIEPHWIQAYGRVVLTGEPASFESFSADLTMHFHVSAFRPKANQFACLVRDVSERMRAERERAALEAELYQAQKMESVGRLAGGVAHDFNNMLGVILGHLELALEEAEPSQPLVADLQEIRKAAEHSAELTRQLLAFARKQIVTPTVLGLDQAVSGMVKMLQRLIGENIVLEQRQSGDIWSVKVDPSQIDQLLANLCVNARDAIDGDGRVIIELGNLTVEAAGRCASGSEVVPGEYVRLAVTDDGCGIAPETLAHIFEPFFTTKGVGKGTGLGLATVYGIVKQNQGFIDVQTALGRGTTFAVHLPRHVGAAGEQGELVAAPARGQETILVVEDEPAILRVTTRILAKLGYVVLAAGTPREALRLAEEHRGHIDLLLSDVMMPEMNGRELARSLLAVRPRLRHLFMSGYTADVIAQKGVLDGSVELVSKPFSRAELAAAIRKALDSDATPERA
jgi:PAS domain S-box-containing protein